jgi:DNA modification methylase
MLNKIIHGDCLQVMKDIPDKSIDVVICDLPYGTTQCKWDSVIPFDELWDAYSRIIKDKGAIVLHSQQPFTSNLIVSNIRSYKYSIIWEKSKATGFLNAKKRPLVAHEEINIFCNGAPPYYPQMTKGKAYDKGIRKKQTENDVYGSFKQKVIKSDGARYPRSVVYFKTAESEGQTYHKTQKPVLLVEYLVNTYSQKGQVVLDNCIGSGTTAVACINTGRNFIGIEKEAKYVDIANKRVSDAIENITQQRLSVSPTGH